jgi:hypothetical protein
MRCPQRVDNRLLFAPSAMSTSSAAFAKATASQGQDDPPWVALKGGSVVINALRETIVTFPGIPRRARVENQNGTVMVAKCRRLL